MADNRERQINSVKPVEPIYLTYTCAARPPDYIDVHAACVFGRDAKGFYWEAYGDQKHYAELGFIKMLFTPKSKTWDEAVSIVK